MNERPRKRVVLCALELLPEYEYNLATAYLEAQATAHPELSRSLIVSRMSFVRPWSLGEIALEIAAQRPWLVGLSCYVWNVREMSQLALLLRTLLPEVGIVCGGPEMMEERSRLDGLFPAVDYFVRGEGEITFVELLGTLLGDRPQDRLTGLSGLLYRNADRVLTENPPRPQVQDLEEIQSPFLGKALPLGIRKVCLETMRGCPYACSFCYYAKGNRKVRYFSMERTLEELRLLAAAGCREIYLMDPTFNISAKRAIRILEEVVSWPDPPRLHLEMKAELLSEAMVDLMARLKIAHLELGLQSTTPEVMDLIERRNRMPTFRRSMQWLRRARITSEVQLIIGLPGETPESFWESYSDLLDLKPDHLSTFPLLVLPGTQIRHQADSLGLKYDPEPPYPLLSTPQLSADQLREINQSCQRMNRIWPYVRFLVEALAEERRSSQLAELRRLADASMDEPPAATGAWIEQIPRDDRWNRLLEDNLRFGRAFVRAESQGQGGLETALSELRSDSLFAAP